MTALATPNPSGLDSLDAVLALCERGRAALSEARDIAEAKNVLAYATTLVTATKAKDLAVEAAGAAYELRIDAERRIAQLIAEQREAGRLDSRGGDRKRHLRPINVAGPDIDPAPSTLADIGISRDQAAEYAKLAAAPDDVYEAAKERVKERVAPQGHMITRAAVLRELDPEGEKRPGERYADADRFVTTCERLRKLTDPAVVAIRFGAYPDPDMAPEMITSHCRRVLTEAREAIDAVLKELAR